MSNFFFIFHGKESTEVQITQKIGKKKGKLLPKNEKISRQKAYTNLWKLNWNISTIKDVLSSLCVHIIYSLLIKKDVCDRQNISIKLPCVCVCVPFVRRSLHFLVKVSPFFSYFLFLSIFIVFTHSELHNSLKWVTLNDILRRR